MADRAAAFVHITTLISLSIVCEEWERRAVCVCAEDCMFVVGVCLGYVE